MCRDLWRAIRSGLVLILVWVTTVAIAAQPDQDLRSRMAALLHYCGVEASPEDVARMTESWTRAQRADISRDERRTAFRGLLLLYSKLQGRDLGARPHVFDGLAAFTVGAFDGGARMHLALPEPRGTPSGRYLHVETRGTGPTPLLLISDLGVDGRKLYASFVERQNRAYTMHIVTLPYAGAARPLPWPERLDYPGRPWLTQIERELLALLDEPRMKGVTLVGTSGGGYFAARLALLRPQQVGKVVLVSALVHTTLRSQSDSDAPATLEERLARVKAVPPIPQLFPAAAVPPPDELRRLIGDPASQHPSARNWMAFAVKDTAVSQAWTFEALSGGFFVPSLRYGWELTSTDLTEQMRSLTVPMLAMGTWHDEGSSNVALPSISQWDELKLRYPSIPLTVATFDDTRAYVSADAPEAFDRALADFLAGRRVHGKTGFRAPRTSPRASVMQAFGGAQLEIAYGRPAVKGRKLWGALVPHGRVWRAGANEATRFVVSADVTIEGRRLAAGAYTFFAIPGETEWTLIFNRVPRQWGAFDYDASFDALRVVVTPAATPHEEHVRYSVQPADASGAIVTLAWETRAVSFRIETIE
jgi:pimeloyl-ACP methyl ester carboxylesterase